MCGWRDGPLEFHVHHVAHVGVHLRTHFGHLLLHVVHLLVKGGRECVVVDSVRDGVVRPGRDDVDLNAVFVMFDGGGGTAVTGTPGITRFRSGGRGGWGRSGGRWGDNGHRGDGTLALDSCSGTRIYVDPGTYNGDLTTYPFRFWPNWCQSIANLISLKFAKDMISQLTRLAEIF